MTISRIIYIVFIIFFSSNLLRGKNFSSDNDTVPKKKIPLLEIKNTKIYPFTLYDSYSSSSSMSMATTGYASATRLLHRSINESALTDKGKKLSLLSALFIQSVFSAWSHEEGHRSVLTTEDIGSISAPFFDKHGVAVVKGVTDLTLIGLRANKLPTYIRLHTGGLESDFLMVKQLRTNLAFKEDNYKNIFPEMMLRNSAMVSYYFSSLFESLEPSIKESPNELENDIVGHDVYGAIKNLHRPNEKFYRYTRYQDLTGTEKTYLKKIAWLSWVNFISPSWLTFKLPNDGKLSFGTGFTMTPFGYNVELDSWIRWKKIKCLLFLQSSQNNNIETGGLGAGLYDIPLSKNLRIDIDGQYFSQPENLSFETSNSFSGGMISTQLKVSLPHSWRIPLEFHVGAKLKSYGFVVGEPYLDKGLFLKFGGALVL
jgi:hypothetical protein